jgi:glycolate oxidase FAD binding subunit
VLAGVLVAIASSQTMPAAVELETPPGRLLVRFETVERAAEQQASEVANLALSRGARTDIVSGADEAALWRAYAARPWNKPGCVIKISALISEIPSLLDSLRDGEAGHDWELVGRAGVGVLLLRADGTDDEQERVAIQLRGRFKTGEGHVSVLRASADLKARLEAWGSVGDALPLMQTIKRQFDPAGILNPGRGPGGL